MTQAVRGQVNSNWAALHSFVSPYPEALTSYRLTTSYLPLATYFPPGGSSSSCFRTRWAVSAHEIGSARALGKRATGPYSARPLTRGYRCARARLTLTLTLTLTLNLAPNPRSTSPHLTSPHLTLTAPSPHLTSPRLASLSPHLTSPHLTSPQHPSPWRGTSAHPRCLNQLYYTCPPVPRTRSRHADARPQARIWSEEKHTKKFSKPAHPVEADA